MAITMIDNYNVERTPFCRSHLLTKLKKAVIVARTVGKDYSDPTFVYSVTPFDLTDKIYQLVETDYNEVRNSIKICGGTGLTGKMGKYIQPRTKGGKDSDTRAFYARPRFLKLIINLEE
jgi:hypothetical protein